ncbi:MAG: c-type cytochrome [Nitrospirae bacterium]|nr:c-type cytochrome [Nitrospirota bacterium]
MRSRVRALLVLVGLAGLLAGYGVWRVRYRELTPVQRGFRVAARSGCFNCHGAGGLQGIANPGSEEEEVPAWVGGTHMMYVENKSSEEIREWILYGAPRRKMEQVEFRVARDAMKVKMPAYAGVICDRDLEYLVAYFRAASGMDAPAKGTPDHDGYREAGEHGCFGCHGPMGLGAPPNPGSLTGYIPSWGSRDFAELVKTEEELDGWILEGTIPRFEENPLARFFLERQKIKMPAYKGVLDEDDLAAIKAYIRWVSSGPRQEG